jgi:hypothetical protein
MMAAGTLDMTALTHPRSTAIEEAPTIVRDDGLRYLSKTSGSPFPNAFASGIGTMSCFFCGTHRGTTSRATQKVMGQSRAVCAPACSKNPRFNTKQGVAGNERRES